MYRQIAVTTHWPMGFANVAQGLRGLEHRLLIGC